MEATPWWIFLASHYMLIPARPTSSAFLPLHSQLPRQPRLFHFSTQHRLLGGTLELPQPLGSLPGSEIHHPEKVPPSRLLLSQTSIPAPGSSRGCLGNQPCRRGSSLFVNELPCIAFTSSLAFSPYSYFPETHLSPQ